jgi:hypothetical protein
MFRKAIIHRAFRLLDGLEIEAFAESTVLFRAIDRKAKSLARRLLECDWDAARQRRIGDRGEWLRRSDRLLSTS